MGFYISGNNPVSEFHAGCLSFAAVPKHPKHAGFFFDFKTVELIGKATRLLLQLLVA